VLIYRSENFGPRIGVHVPFGAGLPKSFVIEELQKLVEALEAGEPAGGLLGDTFLIDDPDQSDEDEDAA
jgi:hypothetical protein